MKKGIIMAALTVLCFFSPAESFAQSDYYAKKAAEYTREAEYYQKKATGYRNEAEYYLKKAESYERETAYYTFPAQIPKAVMLSMLEKNTTPRWMYSLRGRR